MIRSIIIITILSLYWIISYKSLDYILEKNRRKLNYNLPKIGFIYKVSSFSKYYHHFLPSLSSFDKTKIKSREFSYLKEFNRELNKAFLIHLLGIVYIIPFFFLENKIILLINLTLVVSLNTPFILIIYYNKIRLERILIRGKLDSL